MGIAENQMVARLTEAVDLLKRIERNTRPILAAQTFEFFKFKITKFGPVRTDEMKLQVNENAQIVVKAIKDAAGNPARVDGVLSWAIAGEQSLGELIVAEDGLSALFKRNANVGSCKVQVSGDADLGPDQKIIMGEVEVECLAGEAVVFELDATAVPA